MEFRADVLHQPARRDLAQRVEQHRVEHQPRRVPGREEVGEAHLAQAHVDAGVVPGEDLAHALEHRAMEHGVAVGGVQARHADVPRPGLGQRGDLAQLPLLRAEAELGADRHPARRGHVRGVMVAFAVDHARMHLDVERAVVERDPVEGLDVLDHAQVGAAGQHRAGLGHQFQAGHERHAGQAEQRRIGVGHRRTARGRGRTGRCRRNVAVRDQARCVVFDDAVEHRRDAVDRDARTRPAARHRHHRPRRIPRRPAATASARSGGRGTGA